MSWDEDINDAYVKDVMHRTFERPAEVKAEKRAVSEIAVKKGLPLGITKNIGPYIGKGKRKTRRAHKKKSTRRHRSRKHK